LYHNFEPETLEGPCRLWTLGL